MKNIAVAVGASHAPGRYCTASIDPCVPLADNEHIDFYACSCVDGTWACGLCAAGASTCAEAGTDDDAGSSDATADAGPDGAANGPG